MSARASLWRRLWPWLAGAALATAMFAVLGFVTDLRYENSDDSLLVKAFMGFEGEPARFTLYTHTVLAWLLHALSTSVPGVAWFSLYQLALCWFSSAVIVKSCIQLGLSRRLPAWTGALAGLLYLSAFAAFASCRVTYTTTAALAGAAAVAQLMTVDWRGGGACYRGFALALALLVGCYSLRQIALLPPLAYGALTLLWRGWELKRRKSPLRPLLLCAIALTVVLGGLVAVREIEIDARGQRGFIRWHNARISLYDYTPFERDTAPALNSGAEIGENELALMREWYLMDGNITTQALETMRGAYVAADQPALARLSDAAAAIADFLRGNPRYAFACLLMALLWALCMLCARPLGAPYRAAACLALLGGVAFAGYLAWQGRVIFRSADSALFPCAATLAALALNGLGAVWRGAAGRAGAKGGVNAADTAVDSAAISATGIANETSLNVQNAASQPTRLSPIRRVLALSLCALCVATVGAHALLTLRALSGAQDSVSLQRESELERYALAHPDTLLARTPNLLRDTRLLPDVSAGVPQNIVIWGDWYCRSPSWNAQLGRFGFDAERFAATDWLADNLLFATVDDSPPEALAAYIAEGAGAPVRAEKADEYGTLRFFRFVRE